MRSIRGMVHCEDCEPDITEESRRMVKTGVIFVRFISMF